MNEQIKELHPHAFFLADKFLNACNTDPFLADRGVSILVTSAYRSFEEQDALYARGRTAPGAIVTNAKGGQSLHNFRRAFDIVPIRLGKPIWGTTGDDLEIWTHIGELGEMCGLQWAGRWTKFKEFPHFQWLREGETLADLQKSCAASPKDHSMIDPKTGLRLATTLGVRA